MMTGYSCWLKNCKELKESFQRLCCGSASYLASSGVQGALKQLLETTETEAESRERKERDEALRMYGFVQKRLP